MVRALYDKYRLDFQMFDYDIKDFIKFASESEGFLPDVIEIPETKESEEAKEEESHPHHRHRSDKGSAHRWVQTHWVGRWRGVQVFQRQLFLNGDEGRRTAQPPTGGREVVNPN